MNVNRLTRLADLLDRHADFQYRFSLWSWGDIKVTETGFLWWKERNVCNTSACAVGLACLSGEFRDDGLTYETGLKYIIPAFGKLREWQAVAEFFDIPELLAYRLFDPEEYDGPTEGPLGAQAVAARIRKTIARREAANKRRREKRAQARVQRTTAAVEQIKSRALELLAP